MNWDRIAGSWMHIKGQTQKNWGSQNSNYLDILSGNGELLVGKIQERYGISKAEANRRIEELADSLNRSPIN